MPDTLTDAERKLGELDGTFFSSAEAADRLGLTVSDTRALLTAMEHQEQALRVCRDGWVLAWHLRGERSAPELAGYLHDMMQHLGVGYYLSYAAGAKVRRASHHGVMRARVNVETDDIESLELREADGPRDMAVSFHQIDPRHGRPVSLAQRLCSFPTKDGPATIRVGTLETVILDMVERPDRGSSMDHIATIALKALFWKRLDPVLLAEASDLYAPHVARRTGSMLQQIRGIQHRINLRPLLRHVRRRPMQPPVELDSAQPDTTRKADRWGVTRTRKLDPDR